MCAMVTCGVTPISRYPPVALAQPAVSPLGTIRLASFVENGSGTNLRTLRVYGSYALVCVLGGPGLYRDGSGFSAGLGPGDLVWVFPGVPHAYGPAQGARWDEFFIVFDGVIFELWRERHLFANLHPVQRLDAPELWLERLLTVCRVDRDEPWSSTAAIVSLQGVLTDLIALQQTRRSHDEAWLRHAASALERVEVPSGGYPGLARALGVSYETFRKKFARRFGVSPRGYRRRHLIQAALRLIRDQDLSVKEAALRLGFCDEFYFSRVFRDVTGRSPSTLRGTGAAKTKK